MPSGKTGFSSSSATNGGGSSAGAGSRVAMAGGTYVKKEGPRKLMGMYLAQS